MERVSFYDEIARNRRNSILLSLFLIVIIAILATTISYMWAPDYVIIVLPMSIIFMVIYTYSSYIYGDQVVLSSTRARPAEGNEYIYLRDSVEGLSLAAGIPQPKVYVIESSEMNAFATGRDPEHASVAVTTGLMEQLNRQELEGVLAHELSHIRNRDVTFMTLVAVAVGLIAILSDIILRSFRYGALRGGGRGKRDRDRGGGLQFVILAIGFILAIFAPILTRIVQFAVSRTREYMADASGVELTRYSEGLASALEKIMHHNRGDSKVSEAVSHLFFVDPNRSALDSLYATHPPIEERIKKLRAM
jgi:heat shock protein HtpX